MSSIANFELKMIKVSLFVTLFHEMLNAPASYFTSASVSTIYCASTTKASLKYYSLSYGTIKVL